MINQTSIQVDKEYRKVIQFSWEITLQKQIPSIDKRIESLWHNDD